MSAKYKLKDMISRKVPRTDLNNAFDAILKGRGQGRRRGVLARASPPCQADHGVIHIS